MTPRITEAGEVMGNLRSNGYGRDWSMGVGEVREHYLSKEAASQNQGIPISRSALEEIPMPGQLFEGNPVDEGCPRQSR